MPTKTNKRTNKRIKDTTSPKALARAEKRGGNPVWQVSL
jgi:hypothetical protein